MNEFQRCLIKGKIKKLSSVKEKVNTELKAAVEDLKEAKDRFKHKKYKYATINGYYSLFHSARALLYSKGFRERSHYCLKVAIEHLFVKEKMIDFEFIEYFDEALGLRESADYQSVFSKEGAEGSIKNAKSFLKKAREVLSSA